MTGESGAAATDAQAAAGDAQATGFAGRCRDVSADLLASRFLSLVGAPLTDAQRAQATLQDDLSCLNAYGWMSTDGKWHAYDRDDAQGTVRSLLAVEWLECGSKLG